MSKYIGSAVRSFLHTVCCNLMDFLIPNCVDLHVTRLKTRGFEKLLQRQTMIRYPSQNLTLVSEFRSFKNWKITLLSIETLGSCGCWHIVSPQVIGMIIDFSFLLKILVLSNLYTQGGV